MLFAGWSTGEMPKRSGGGSHGEATEGSLR